MDLSVSGHPGQPYSCEGYMALALVGQRTLPTFVGGLPEWEKRGCIARWPLMSVGEPLRGFMRFPVFRTDSPTHSGIVTYSESVQPLQSVKLIYQPCSRL